MKHRYSKKVRAFSVLAALVLVCLPASAWCGTLKIIMNDGNSLEVPYYWVSDGEYKFDVQGGIVGVPRSQVASVQEVLESREFDPESILQRAGESSTAEEQKIIGEMIASGTPAKRCEVANPEEGARIFRPDAAEVATEKPKIYGQKFSIEKSIPTLCEEPGGPVLLFQELMTSSADLRGSEFVIILYDADGNVISRRNCEVYPLTLDQNAQQKLKIKGRTYLIRASVKPDQKIKRYEIAAVQR